MVNENKPAKAGFIVGALAAIGGAIGAWLGSSRAWAQDVISSIVGLDKAAMDLLSAIAAGVGAILDKLDDILTAIKAVGGGGGGAGFPPNAHDAAAMFIGCPNSQPKAYRLPSIAVPEGMQLVIKGAPNNWGIVYIARSEQQAGQPLQSWPLLPNEGVGYFVKNSDVFWVGAVLSPPIIPTQDGVYITVEQP